MTYYVALQSVCGSHVLCADDRQDYEARDLLGLWHTCHKPSRSSRPGKKFPRCIVGCKHAAPSSNASKWKRRKAAKTAALVRARCTVSTRIQQQYFSVLFAYKQQKNTEFDTKDTHMHTSNVIYVFIYLQSMHPYMCACVQVCKYACTRVCVSVKSTSTQCMTALHQMDISDKRHWPKAAISRDWLQEPREPRRDVLREVLVRLVRLSG